MEWTLDEGLKLIRILQPKSRQYGYHLALGGSVLNVGKSEKDLDLYFLPLDNSKKIKLEGLLAWLTDLWGKPEDIWKIYDRDDPNVPPQAPQPQDFWWAQEVNADAVHVHAQLPQFEVVRQEDGNVQVRHVWQPIPAGLKADPSPYKKKLKFMRGGEDRIDVFIL